MSPLRDGSKTFVGLAFKLEVSVVLSLRCLSVDDTWNSLSANSIHTLGKL